MTENVQYWRQSAATSCKVQSSLAIRSQSQTERFIAGGVVPLSRVSDTVCLLLREY